MKVVENSPVLMGKAHVQENWQSSSVSKDVICDAVIVILCGPMNLIANIKRKLQKRF